MNVNVIHEVLFHIIMFYTCFKFYGLLQEIFTAILFSVF